MFVLVQKWGLAQESKIVTVIGDAMDDDDE